MTTREDAGRQFRSSVLPQNGGLTMKITQDKVTRIPLPQGKSEYIVFNKNDPRLRPSHSGR